MTFKPVDNPFFTLQLEQPIQYLGEPISEVAFREPGTGDILRVGIPVKYDPSGERQIEFDERKALAMLSRLSGLPVEGTLERMLPNDTVSAMWSIARFFIPGLRTRPEANTTSSPKPDEQPAS